MNRPLGPSDFLVVVEELEERAAPSRDAEILNRIYRGQRVTVTDSVGGWARVTELGFQPSWVDWAGLGKSLPGAHAGPEIPAYLRDSRIAPDAMPRVGQDTHTADDILILWRGAKHMLDSGRCSRIDLASKSGSRPGTYYVACEDAHNEFFTPDELPPRL